MIKKFFSSILTFILLILVTTLCCLLTFRHLIFSDTIKDMTSELLSGNEMTISENVFKETFSTTGIPEDVSQYIDENKTTEYVSSFFEEYIKYLLGVGDLPKMNNDKLKEIIDNAVAEYEKANNTDIDTGIFYNLIDEYDRMLKEEHPTMKVNDNIIKVIKLIYNKKLLYIIIAGIATCLALLFIINKNIIEVIKHSAISLTINGVGLKLIAWIISIINFEGEEGISNVVDMLQKQINITAYGSLILAIIILIIANIINNKKEKIAI